jgi:hypothetical protein
VLAPDVFKLDATIRERRSPKLFKRITNSGIAIDFAQSEADMPENPGPDARKRMVDFAQEA